MRVGVALTGLAAKEEHQPDLFEKPKNARLVQAIDAVNEIFGCTSFYMALTSPARKPIAQASAISTYLRRKTEALKGLPRSCGSCWCGPRSA
jgi:hypothetical protein